MIIACPACATRYAVPDSAIGVEGRTVRCAKCRHSWFQDASMENLAEVGPGATAETGSTPTPETSGKTPPAPSPVDTSLPETPPPAPRIHNPADELPKQPLADRSPAQGPRRTYYDDTSETQSSDESPSRFDFAPPFRPRRNWAKIGMLAAIVFAVVTLGLAGLVAWAGLPDWVPVARPTFAQAQQDLVLDFPAKRQDRRTLPNGTEYFGASGTVSNIGRESRDVPTILIVLRDARDRIVYSWEVVPPKRELAPGETITINEAVTDVPKSAKSAEIGWKPA